MGTTEWWLRERTGKGRQAEEAATDFDQEQVRGKGREMWAGVGHLGSSAEEGAVNGW